MNPRQLAAIVLRQERERIARQGAPRFGDRTWADDLAEREVIDDTPHVHMHGHGGAHVHNHRHPDDHAHSARTDTPRHEVTTEDEPDHDLEGQPEFNGAFNRW